MRIGEIVDMDEVADAGSITRLVVGAQNLKIWPPAQSRFDRNRYGMSFRRMPFANSALGIRSSSIEVAQNNGTKALVEVQVL